MDYEGKFWIVLVLLAAYSSSCTAQSTTQNVYGNVINTDGQPLEGVMVVAWINGENRGNYTSSDYGEGYEAYYNIDIQGLVEDAGSIVSFTIEGVSSNQTIVFTPLSSTNLDLVPVSYITPPVVTSTSSTTTSTVLMSTTTSLATLTTSVYDQQVPPGGEQTTSTTTSSITSTVSVIEQTTTTIQVGGPQTTSTTIALSKSSLKKGDEQTYRVQETTSTVKPGSDDDSRKRGFSLTTKHKLGIVISLILVMLMLLLVSIVLVAYYFLKR